VRIAQKSFAERQQSFGYFWSAVHGLLCTALDSSFNILLVTFLFFGKKLLVACCWLLVKRHLRFYLELSSFYLFVSALTRLIRWLFTSN